MTDEAKDISEDSVRQDLEAAFDAADKEDKKEEPKSDEEAGRPAEDPEEPIRAAGEEPAKEEPAAELAAEPAKEELPVVVEEESPLLKAPTAWSAPMREKWGELPNDVREYVHQREKEAGVAIQRNAEEAKYGGAMQQVLRPFESVMAMESSTPFQAVQALAQTAATLRMGTPVEKANTIKHLINSYNVDIEALDKALVNEEQLTPEQTAMSSMLDQRFKPFEALMTEVQQGRAAHQASSVAAIDSEVSKFEDTKPEFYADVREDMADFIEMKYRRGVNVGLKDAYDACINMRPELKTILTARENAKKIAEKTAASSSLTGGTQAPGGEDVGKRDLRGDLEAAWDAQHV